MISKIFPAFFFTSIAIIFIETLSYSGFFYKNTGFDLKTLILFFSVIILLIPLLKIKQNENLVKINNILFPLFLSASIIFTMLEKVNYPNFIYSTFHINFESLTLLTFLSGSLLISTTGYKLYKKQKEISIFLLGIFLLILGFLIRNWPDGTFFQLIREDMIFEQLQFIFYLAAGILSGILMLKSFSQKKPKIVILFYLLFFSFLIFIAGEEISWGQRILDITTPENLAAINTQEETTLHNINVLNPFQYLMYMALSLILSFSWILKNKFPKNIQEIFPSKYLVPFFLPIFIFYLHINFLNGSYWEWQEFTELLLSIGLLLFFLNNLKINRKIIL